MKTHTLIVRLAGFYLLIKALMLITGYYQKMALLNIESDSMGLVKGFRAVQWEFRLGVAGVLIGLFMMFRAGWLASVFTADAREDDGANKGRTA